MFQHRMITRVLIALVLIVVSMKVWAKDEESAEPTNKGRILLNMLKNTGNSDFPKVTAPRPFSFPADHGPHPEYRLEWWYYTGNLETKSGRHFGYQLTFFRNALTPKMPKRASNFATNQIYMAHFALTDVKNKRFYSFERFSRGAAGLAGAEAQPFSVWLENWSVKELERDTLQIRPGIGPDKPLVLLNASEDDIALDFMLQSGKPVVLQGDKGMSQKSATFGNASYYYSLTRMPTSGTIQIGGETFHVKGLSWLDREWGSSMLEKDQEGWDWFALQLSDNREVMFYKLRQTDGTATPQSSGTFIFSDGKSLRLTLSDIELDVLDDWRSPIDGTRYPARWQMRIPKEQVALLIEPYIPNQELNHSTIQYWEGAVKVTGTSDGEPIIGSGYVELTGYDK